MIPVQIKCIDAEIPPLEMLEIERNYHQAFDRLNHLIREAQITLRNTKGPKYVVDRQCKIQLRFYPRGIAVTKSSGSTFSQAAIDACYKMQQLATKRLNKRRSASIKNSQIKLNEGDIYGTP